MQTRGATSILRFLFFLNPTTAMNPNGPSAALWQEARNTDGRVYYYNVQTKATQWTKPQELMTAVEVSAKPNCSELG
jgi:hypothetical protein